MNRSILIVICDFLLISLLAFSTVDMKKLAHPAAARAMQLNPGTNQVSGRQDLGDVMRLALDEERKNRDQMRGELTRSQAVIQEQSQQIQSNRSQLQSKEQQAAQLAEERAKLTEEQTHLQNQVAAAQTNIATLNEQLHTSAVETVITKEQRAAVEAEARKQSEKAAALEQQLALLQKTNQAMQTDRMAMQNQLQMSEAANRSAMAQMSQLQQQVQDQQRENGRLAEGFKAMAESSSNLVREMHESRPMTPNMIFEELISNRVLASFTAVKPGLFKADAEDRRAHIILVTDGSNTFALGHVQDTPLMLWDPGTQWEELRGTLAHGSAVVPIASLSFSKLDPRVVLVPVAAADARALGCKVYQLSKDPYVFQEAVVVGTRDNYYGECRFQIDMATPNYLKMDHNSLKGLFGKFNPSKGDLVLSKSGELLGVMANDNYCASLRQFETMATFRFGPQSRQQKTAQTLATLYSVVSKMPYRLQ
jgi:hypothetical protein